MERLKKAIVEGRKMFESEDAESRLKILKQKLASAGIKSSVETDGGNAWLETDDGNWEVDWDGDNVAGVYGVVGGGERPSMVKDVNAVVKLIKG
jgi:hypothetical protein